MVTIFIEMEELYNALQKELYSWPFNNVEVRGTDPDTVGNPRTSWVWAPQNTVLKSGSYQKRLAFILCILSPTKPRVPVISRETLFSFSQNKPLKKVFKASHL